MRCLSSNDINIACENYLRTLQHLLDEYSPLKTLTKKITFTKLPYITHDIKKEIKRRKNTNLILLKSSKE